MVLQYVISALCVAVLLCSTVFMMRGLRAAPLARRLVDILLPISQIVIVCLILGILGSADFPLWVYLVALGLCVVCAVADWVLAKALHAAEEKELEEERVGLLESQMALQGAYHAQLEAEEREARQIRRQAAEELRCAQELLAQSAPQAPAVNAPDVPDAAASSASPAAHAAHAVELMDGTARHFCDNRVIDALLTSKARLCEQGGIDLQTELSVPQDLPLASSELCAVFSNLMDNAIHACEELDADEDKRWIRLRAHLQAGHLVVGTQNEYVPERAAAQDAKAAQAKSSTLPEHGWGLMILKRVASKHGGSFETQEDGSVFKATIVLPLLEVTA